MKCKICGHRTSGEKALPNMMKHYRKAHPKQLTEKRAQKPKMDMVKGIHVGKNPYDVFMESIGMFSIPELDTLVNLFNGYIQSKKFGKI